MNSETKMSGLKALLPEPERSFDEPWQAEAFATTLRLSLDGVFSWAEWVTAFSSTIASDPMRDGESVGEAYYRQWMTTLESLLGVRLCLSEQAVTERQALWRSAYLNTKHGDPVMLINAPQNGISMKETHEHREHHHHHGHGIESFRRIAPEPATIVKARTGL